MLTVSDLAASFQKDEEKFRKCATNLDRIGFFFENEGSQRLVTHIDTTKYAKNDEKAVKIRGRGKASLTEKNYIEAIEYYTCSITFAKTPAVAALAYANRAAALAKRRLYKECLADIERALQNDYPEDKKLDLTYQQSKVAQKIKNHNENVTQPKNHKSDAVVIESDKKYGRQIIATKDIQIGDLLLTEKPFAAVLVSDFLIHCHECLKLCYNPIPCDNCTQVVYCNEKCKEQAFNTYHKYECSILPKIEHLYHENNTELKLALKMTFLALVDPENFKEIQKLSTHTDKRPLRDIYLICRNSAIVFNLFKETSLFKDFPDFENEFKELFMQNLQIVDINAVAINHLVLHLGGYETVRYGAGLYSMHSLFNHSCHPNCFFYHDGSKIVVRALGTIKKGDQCFISYYCTYGTVPKLRRQTELLNKYYFDCTCVACEGNWPEEAENKDFDDPFAAVQLALLEKNTDMISSLLPIFVSKLKSIEKHAPVSGITCLRQLIVDCYQVYESPKNL